MNENITLAIIGIGMGLFGAAVWYAEMEPPHLHAFFFSAAP